MKGNHVKKNKPAAHFIPKPLKGKTNSPINLLTSKVVLLVIASLGFLCCTLQNDEGLVWNLRLKVSSQSSLHFSQIESQPCFNVQPNHILKKYIRIFIWPKF